MQPVQTTREAGTVSQGFPVVERDCEVLSNVAVNARYKHLVVAAAVPHTLVRPGQFFHLLCPPRQAIKPFLRRPMSVYAIGRDRIGFLYKVTGPGTQALSLLRPEERISLMGPLGIGFTFQPHWKRVLVVARGVGLATMAPLLPQAARDGVAVTALLSARSPADLMESEFVQGTRAEVHAVFDSDGSSAVSAVETKLRSLVERERPDMIYTCGSDRLLRLLQRLVREHRVPGEVALEQQMACALGVCLCCVRSFESGGERVHRRVCCEGPVFDLLEVAEERAWPT